MEFANECTLGVSWGLAHINVFVFGEFSIEVCPFDIDLASF